MRDPKKHHRCSTVYNFKGGAASISRCPREVKLDKDWKKKKLTEFYKQGVLDDLRKSSFTGVVRMNNR